MTVFLTGGVRKRAQRWYTIEVASSYFRTERRVSDGDDIPI